MLVDTHCHLTSAALQNDTFQVWKRARDVSVKRLITVATDADDSRRTVTLADQYDGVFATIGIHPHEAGKVSSGDAAGLRELRHNSNVVAWGEIGLDYHYDFAPAATQKTVFAWQLVSALKTDLPVIIHCREAVDDTVAMLLDHGYDRRRVVFHCFTGTAAEAERIAAHGWRISMTGIVTFRKSTELQGIAREYPLDQLMLETDAPYLSPEPKRSVRPNEPSLLPHTARFLAELKGLSYEELADVTTANAISFFGLDDA
jgi:TatD DNase family protein